MKKKISFEQTVLDTLKERKRATAPQLSEELNRHNAQIHKYLGALVKKGKVHIADWTGSYNGAYGNLALSGVYVPRKGICRPRPKVGSAEFSRIKREAMAVAETKKQTETNISRFTDSVWQSAVRQSYMARASV